LALQGQFAENAGPILPGSIEIRSESPEAQDFYQTLKDSALLALTDTGQPVNGSDALFHITLLDDFDQQLYSDIGDQPGVEIRFAATLPLRDQSLIMAAIRQVF